MKDAPRYMCPAFVPIHFMHHTRRTMPLKMLPALMLLAGLMGSSMAQFPSGECINAITTEFSSRITGCTQCFM